MNAVVLVLQTVSVQELLKSRHFRRTLSHIVQLSLKKRNVWFCPQHKQVVPLAAPWAEEPNSYGVSKALLGLNVALGEEQGGAVGSGREHAGYGVVGCPAGKRLGQTRCSSRRAPAPFAAARLGCESKGREPKIILPRFLFSYEWAF